MKYILLFTLLFITLFSNSQNTEPSDRFQTDFVRHCLKQYRDQHMKAYYFQGAGLVLAGVGLLIDPKITESIYSDGRGHVITKNYNLNKTFGYAGAGAVLFSFAILIDSEKWLKRAYVGPDGVGVVFKF